MSNESDSTLVVFPAVSDGEVALGLRRLTERIVATGAAPEHQGGILGGDYGYGAAFENDVFMMHPFCWCESDDCPWCWGCTCPDAATTYHLADGTTVDVDVFFDQGGVQAGGRWVRHPEHFCDYCTGDRVSAPNFRHKPSGSTVSWYKYIGRGMEVDLTGEWSAILTECLASLDTPPATR